MNDLWTKQITYLTDGYRIIERWYTEDGHCMPSTKGFRQSSYKPPQRLMWEVDNSLEKEINAAVLFAQKVYRKMFWFNVLQCDTLTN